MNFLAQPKDVWPPMYVCLRESPGVVVTVFSDKSFHFKEVKILKFDDFL